MQHDRELKCLTMFLIHLLNATIVARVAVCVTEEVVNHTAPKLLLTSNRAVTALHACESSFVTASRSVAFVQLPHSHYCLLR